MADQPTPSTQLEEAISAAADRFADAVDSLAADPYLREGILRMAIREVTWSLYECFGESHEALHDQLGSMGMAVQSRIGEDARSPAG